MTGFPLFSQMLSLLCCQIKKSLDECLQRIRDFEFHQKQYEQLRDKLKTLPDQLEYDALIPIAEPGAGNVEYISGGLARNAQSQVQHIPRPPLAFMPGRIHRTNEVLVHLGDNWFVDQSARQASEIVDRRLAKLDSLLSDLKREKDGTQDWLNNVRQVKEEKQQFVEIMEKYDEEKEVKWRQQHRERLRKVKQQEAKKKTNISFDPSTLPEVSEEEEEEEEEETDVKQLAEKEFNQVKETKVVEREPKESTARATVLKNIHETFHQESNDENQLPSRFSTLAMIAERSDNKLTSVVAQDSNSLNKPMSKFKAERLARMRR